jgi:hypothetical protein
VSRPKVKERGLERSDDTGFCLSPEGLPSPGVFARVIVTEWSRQTFRILLVTK